MGEAGSLKFAFDEKQIIPDDIVRSSFVLEDETCRNRRPFPYECTHEWKRCTGHVMTDKRTRGPTESFMKNLSLLITS